MINQIRAQLLQRLERHHPIYPMNFDLLYQSVQHHLLQTLPAGYHSHLVSLDTNWSTLFIFVVDISAENITIRKPTTGREQIGTSNGSIGVPISATRGAVRPDHQNIHFTSKKEIGMFYIFTPR